ncbi:EAL domain-containing protein [Alkalihalobacillus sp. MEB130]|nr:EAL domain-containing protein [Alkalihalobacillus sp. MEB130]
MFQSKNPKVMELLGGLSSEKMERQNTVLFRYKSYNQLEEIMREIEESFANEELDQVFGTYLSNSNKDMRFVNMTSFPMLHERIKNRDYLTIINQRMFTQHMQPIVHLQKEGVFGYEFLLRQMPQGFSFYPGELFSFSQRAGLQSNLDSQARIASIEVSSKILKRGIKRFINFLPSSIYDPTHCLKSTFQAVEAYNVDPNDLVFEVVETEKIDNIDHLKNIFQTYQDHGINVALDDLGSGYATLDVLKELKPNYAKIDRGLIDYCDQNKEKQSRIKAIVEIAQDHGMILLAEGIERIEEAEFCQQLGIPLAQGYYFGKPSEEPLVQDQVLSL